MLAVSTTFFNQQIFHSRCLATCLVKYMVFTGTVCPSYIHLCEYSVQILIKVLKQNIETGSLEELPPKNVSMDAQEVLRWGLSNQGIP